jgi:hypothetical protein
MNNIIPIYINSRDRNDYKTTTTTDFTVNLRKSIKNISAVDVGEIVIPKTHLLINNTNNLIKGKFCSGNIKTDFSIIISSGNYNIDELKTELNSKISTNIYLNLFDITWVITYNLSTLKYSSTLTYVNGIYIDTWGLEIIYTPLLDIIGLGIGYDEILNYKSSFTTDINFTFERSPNIIPCLKYNITSSVLTSNINTSYMKSNNKIFNISNSKNIFNINTRQLMNHNVYMLPDNTVPKTIEYGRHIDLKQNFLIITNDIEIIIMNRQTITSPFIFSSYISFKCDKILKISLSDNTEYLGILYKKTESGIHYFNLKIFIRVGITWNEVSEINNVFGTVPEILYDINQYSYELLMYSKNIIFVSGNFNSLEAEPYEPLGLVLYEIIPESNLYDKVLSIVNYNVDIDNETIILSTKWGYGRNVLHRNGVYYFGFRINYIETGYLYKLEKLEGKWTMTNLNCIVSHAFSVSEDLKTIISCTVENNMDYVLNGSVLIYNLNDGFYELKQTITDMFGDGKFCVDICSNNSSNESFLVSNYYNYLYQLTYENKSYNHIKIKNNDFKEDYLGFIKSVIKYDNGKFIYSTPETNSLYYYNNDYNKLQSYPKSSLNKQGKYIHSSGDTKYVIVTNDSLGNITLYKKINGIYTIFKRFEINGTVACVSDNGETVAIGDNINVYIYKYNNDNTWTETKMVEEFSTGYKLDITSDGKTVLTNSNYAVYKYTFNNFWSSEIVFSFTPFIGSYVRNSCISGDSSTIVFTVYDSEYYIKILKNNINHSIQLIQPDILFYMTIDTDYNGNTVTSGYFSSITGWNGCVVYNFINNSYIFSNYLDSPFNPLVGNVGYDPCYTPPISISSDGKKILCSQIYQLSSVTRTGYIDLYKKQDNIWNYLKIIRTDESGPIGNVLGYEQDSDRGGIYATDSTLFIGGPDYNSNGRTWYVELEGYRDIIYSNLTVIPSNYTVNQLIDYIKQLFILDHNLTLSVNNDYNYVTVSANTGNTFSISGTFDYIKWTNTNLLQEQKSDILDLSINNNIIKTILLSYSISESLLTNSEKNINFRKYPAGYSIENFTNIDIQLRDERDRLIDLNNADWTLTLFITIQS